MARNRGRNEWQKLTKRDLTNFDDYGERAVLYAMKHGGVGKISNRGHAMIKTPSGEIMGVAPDTRKARQVIAIKLRDLFGNGGLVDIDEEAAAERVRRSRAAQAAAAAVSPVRLDDEPTHGCYAPECDAVFVTEGARYAHIHKTHEVCPEPGCWYTRDDLRSVRAHARTAHAAPGQHPRQIWAARQREAAATPTEAQEAPKTLATEAEGREKPTTHARAGAESAAVIEVVELDVAGSLTRIEKALADLTALQARVEELEQENRRLRQVVQEASEAFDRVRDLLSPRD